MTNPARQEIIDAHDALENLGHMAWNGAEFCGDTEDTELCALWKKQILAALPPKPKLTMADVEWDDDEHYLAEAESESGVKVVMLSQNRDFIRCIQPPNAGDVVIGVPSEDLTPTGRRYTPTEVQE